MDDKVLAKVNGKEIKQSDVEVMYASLGQEAGRFAGEEGYKKLLEQIVFEQLVSEQAMEKNHQNDEEYLMVIEKLKRSLLAQHYVGLLMRDIEIAESEMLAFYDGNVDKFCTEDAVEASHILVSSIEEATEILGKIKEGLDFAKAAETYSSCPSKSNGGNLGEFGKGRMVPEFEEAAFALNEGEISEPVKTQFGYHIIKLNKKKPSRLLKYDEAKESIKNRIAQKKQNEKYDELSKELNKKYKVEYFI